MSAIRLTGSFYDLHGTHYRADIHDTAYSGSSSAFTVKYCAINYDSDNKEDLSSPLIGSRADVGMVVEYDDTVLPAFIEDFATSAEDRFFLEIYNVTSSRSVWRGIMTPDFAGENDTAPRYEFKVSAICGLATLKNKPYHNGTALYTGIDRFTAHLTTALKKMVHTDTFWGATDQYLSTAVDWWAASMASGADDDAMYQGGVDHAAFWNYKTEGGIDKDVLSSWDVLWHILKTFGCRILQVDGVWWLEQISYRSDSPYYTRRYSKSGAFLSSATNSGANVINQTAAGAKLATVAYDFLPALKKSLVFYDVKIRRNFLSGTNLGPTNTQIFFDQQISSNGGDAICRLKGQVFFGIKNLSYSGGANDILFWVPTLQLKIGGNYLKRAYTISNFNANVEPPVWTTNNTDRIYLPYNLGPVVGTGLSISGSFNFEILTPALPSDGDDNDLTFNAGSILKWDGTAANPAQFQVTWSASNLFLEVYDEGTPIISEDQVMYEAVNPEEMSEVLETNVRLGTAILSNSAGRIMRWNGSIWTVATNWGQGVDTRNKAIGDLLAVSLLNARELPRRRLNGSLLGDFRMHRLIQTSDGKKWMMQSASWSVNGNVIQGAWFELDYGASGVNSTPIKIKVIPNGPTYPPIPDPTNPQGLTNNSPGFNVNQAPTVLAPVAYNALDGEISSGATVTSIPIKTASLGNEFLAGDGVTLVNPQTGQFQTFTIATAPALGATSLSVSSTAALYNFPEDSYLVVKQNAYAFSLPTASNGDYLAFTSPEWVARNFNEDVDDRVAALLVEGANITLTYNDGAGTLTIASASGGTNYQTFRDSGTDKTQRAAANFVDTARISFTLTDDGANGETEISADLIPGGNITTTYLALQAVTDAVLRDSAGLSVIGRSANTTGNPGDIVAANDGEVLRRSGTSLGFGTVATAGIANNAIDNTKIRQGVARSVIGVTGNATANVADIQGTADQVLRVNTAGTALAFGTVETGGITNSAVTYAKIQNVTATSRVLGRITAGAGVVEELTVANLYTLLGLSAAAGRIMIATGTNTITTSAQFLWDNVNNRQTITGTVAATGANNAFLNLNSGALAADTDFLRMSGHVTGKMIATIVNANNASVAASSIFSANVGGAAAGDPMMQFIINGVVTHTIGTDNSDGDKFKITPNATAPGGTANKGFIMTNDATPLHGINKDAPGHPLDVTGRTRSTEFINLQDKPTVGTLGAGLGTGPVINDISGSNNGFSITFTTGTTPTAGGDLFTVTYATPFPAIGFPVIAQGNDNAAADITKFSYNGVTNASFVLKARAGQALAASTQYLLYFSVFGI